MPKLHLLLLGTLLSLAAHAQHALSEGSRISHLTYAYKIEPAEMLYLFTKKPDSLPAHFLHTLVDSFSAAQSSKLALPGGNYILLYAYGGFIKYDVITSGDLSCRILGNNRDFSVALLRKNGYFVQTANVWLNNQSVPFEIQNQAYRLKHARRSGLLKVYDNNILYLFNVAEQTRRVIPIRRWIQQWVRKIRYAHQWKPRQLFKYGTAHERKFAGFIAFDKPMYKPGDTVQVKAWVTQKKGKPVNRPLLLRLSNDYFDTDTILATLQPYRPGGYTAHFVIDDSLNLDLDEEYLVTLEEPSSRAIDVKTYDGDLDEEEYAAKRKVLLRRTFRYEDYDLHSIHFSIRADNEKHQRNETMSVYAKATDENELPILDGRLRILVTSNRSASSRFNDSHVFLPDTLWQYETALEPMGETRIVLPDSIFPKASFGYKISATLRNSENEERTEQLESSFEDESYQLYFTQKGDSISVEERCAGKQVSDSGMLYLLDQKDDTIAIQKIPLPFTWRRNDAAASYDVQTSRTSDSYEEDKSSFAIACNATRTSDSVFIQSVNTQKFFFWYTIFAGHREVQSGYTQSLSFAGWTTTRQPYSITFRYMVRGEIKSKDYGIPFRKKLLNLKVIQPAFIYPGKTQDIQVAVTDSKGHPVGGADITAYAFTNKFEKGNTPSIPYFGKMRFRPARFRRFSAGPLLSMQMSDTLQWDQWAHTLGLDSMEYFRFLHPNPVYHFEEPAAESITQVAPFLARRGFLDPIYYLYIDEQPRYFSQSTQSLLYSFPVSPGIHSLRFRTAHQQVMIDSIQVLPRVKNFISILADSQLVKGLRIKPMPDTLTNAEQREWGNYMLEIDNNYGEAAVAIQQYQSVYLVNPPGATARRNIVAGPFQAGNARLTVSGQFGQDFEPEGGYAYEIKPGLIKMKQLPTGQRLFRRYLFGTEHEFSLTDQAISANSIEVQWQRYLQWRNARTNLFESPALPQAGNGRLVVSIREENEGDIFPQQLLLFRYDDPDYLRIYFGSSRDLGFLSPGYYRLFVLFSNNEYLLRDSIFIRPAGINYYACTSITKSSADSVSKAILSVINAREVNKAGLFVDHDLSSVKQSFNQLFLPISGFRTHVSGRVTAEKDAGIAGATVTVKGSRYGTSTDAKGNFSMLVPENGTLVFSAVGYETEEHRISGNDFFNVHMKAHSSSLDEVVVVGYGSVRKKELTGSVSVVSGMALAGKVAGVSIAIRGIRSIGNNAPLIIIDGLPYSGDLADLDPNAIKSVEVLKDAAATNIYGNLGTNGVIVITTNTGKLVQPPAVTEAATHSLRRRFRDWAYWRPQERTDAKGIAKFRVQFPDDITRWHTTMIAATANGQTGLDEGSINAFKQTSATMSLPHFLIQGDTAGIIAKVQHYGNDTVKVRRQFSAIASDTSVKALTVFRNTVDTFKISNQSTDSLHLFYAISNDEMMLDGEEKQLPVFLRGTIETKGYFAALQNDSIVHFDMPMKAGPVKLHAEVSLQPVLLDEIEKLQSYRYYCNEQLASKLKATLLQRSLLSSMHQPVKGDKLIQELVTRLEQAQASNGLWGWWAANEPSLWITQHVWEALQKASAAGFPNKVDKTATIAYYVHRLPILPAGEQLRALQLLSVLGAKPDYPAWIDSIYHHREALSVYQQLQLMVMKQSLGLPVSVDSLLSRRQQTMLGNIYWGKPAPQLFDNDIEQTELVYRILKKAGGHERELQLIRNYFMEKRSLNGWNNTWQSSLILESVVPDVIAQNETASPELLINDSIRITHFPYDRTFLSTSDFRLVQRGTAPVYLSLSQSVFERNPQQYSNGFVVKSSFQQHGNQVAQLKAGVSTNLKVEVQVLHDASMIMIEVPIPAGCYYAEKQQSWLNNEVHRSYENGHVQIFCSALKQGNYQFTVSLQPRFTGRYFLNPARASMMYFPIFYGQEAEKKINIF